MTRNSKTGFLFLNSLRPVFNFRSLGVKAVNIRYCRHNDGEYLHKTYLA